MIGTTFGVQGKTTEMAEGKFQMANLKFEIGEIGDWGDRDVALLQSLRRCREPPFLGPNVGAASALAITLRAFSPLIQ
jgi:hypothetical protein